MLKPEMKRRFVRDGIMLLAGGLGMLALLEGGSGNSPSDARLIRRAAEVGTTELPRDKDCPPSKNKVEDVKIIVEARIPSGGDHSKDSGTYYKIDAQNHYFHEGTWVVCGTSTNDSFFQDASGKRHPMEPRVIITPVRYNTNPTIESRE